MVPACLWAPATQDASVPHQGVWYPLVSVHALHGECREYAVYGNRLQASTVCAQDQECAPQQGTYDMPHASFIDVKHGWR
eukprot:5662110-Prymnesium_polylepis.1